MLKFENAVLILKCSVSTLSFSVVYQKLVIHMCLLNFLQQYVEEKQKNFKWTDSEGKLLLRITQEYKVAIVRENIDWEMCQNSE